MLDEYGMPYIEGGWPGSNPKDVEFFRAARGMSWQTAKLAAFGSTRHRANRAEDDPNLRELVAAETPVVTIFGKSWLLHVTEVLGATPAENLDMIADSVGFIVDRGRELRLRRRALLRRLSRRPRLRARDAPRRARGGRPDARPVRHERRHPDRRAARDRRRRPRARSRRTRGRRRAVTWGIHTHNDAELAVANSIAAVAGRHPPRPGDDQRLRRAVRQREHGRDPRQPRAEDGARARAGRRRRPDRAHGALPLGRRDRQPDPERLPAVRRAVGVRPQGRRPRRRRREGRAELPARRPDRRRQRGPARRQRARRQGEHPDPRRAARPPARRRHRPDGPLASSSSSSRTRASRSRAPRRASSC